MSGIGKYAEPQLSVHLREDGGKIVVKTVVLYPNSEGALRDHQGAGIDDALDFIRESWGLSAPGREPGAREAVSGRESAPPSVTVQWPGLQEHRRYLELRFAAPEGADAYEAWLRSGAAHEAFGKWAQSARETAEILDDPETMRAIAEGEADDR